MSDDFDVVTGPPAAPRRGQEQPAPPAPHSEPERQATPPQPAK